MDGWKQLVPICGHLLNGYQVWVSVFSIGFSFNLGWMWSRPSSPMVSSHSYDVFLGGSSGCNTWRNDITIPILRFVHIICPFEYRQLNQWRKECNLLIHIILHLRYIPMEVYLACDNVYPLWVPTQCFSCSVLLAALNVKVAFSIVNFNESLICIPFRQHGVSYFHPQMQKFDPLMFSIERRAKEDSNILLFVISKDTTAVTCLLEV